MKKDIIFVTGSMRRGGAERVISILANELVQRGWNITIISILYDGCGYALDEKINLIDISKSYKNQILDAPRIILKLREIIKKRQPNIVVSFMVTINIATWIATRFINIAFIPSERNDPSIGRKKLLQVLQKIVYANSTYTVFQTQYARDFFSKKIKDKAVIIPNPIEVKCYAKKEKSKKIVTVGRMEKQKNHILLIDAFSIVHTTYPEYTLHIYGDGSEKKTILQHIKKYKLEDSIYLHGNVENVHEQISDAEIFVLSSNFEGQSNALLEAMMMGLPCITTNCSGIDEIIKNGESGIVVPINNKEKLSKAICDLITDNNLRKKIGENGLKQVLTCSTKNIVEQWEMIFYKGI